MTQSGQGDEQQPPAVRPAHEGVVLPSDGGAPWSAGGQANQPAEPAAPAGGQPWGQSWGPQSAPQGGLPPGQLPPEQPQQGGYAPQHGAYPPPQQPYGQQDGYGSPQDPYQQPQHQPQPYAQPLPPEAGPGGDADATQYIAPVPGADPNGYQQSPGQAGDADATQYIPPVPGGAPYGIRPGAPGDRQPPAEFDSLFRNPEPAGATQQMSQVDPAQHQQPPHQQPFPGAYGQQAPPPAAEPYRSGLQGVSRGPEPEPEPHGRTEERRRSPHIPLIAAVVVGCAVVGLGAGALMSGGDDSGKDDKQPVASQSSSAGDPSTQAADPAKPQAEALDKLLADSNNSRAAVIGAVEKIKNCSDLDQAAEDLKGAAAQRRELVTRLEGISIDQLPGHEELASSLKAAWKASAEADDHYAAWAGQAKRNHKKICKGGTAKSTDETGKAANSSGEATQAKKKASGLWNSVARKYGLTEREPVQL
ncbi:hypothetical protein ACQSMD_15100 [Streptomyces flavovirens]|uniref:hypothetical protein n=1 Tax=Streptomyces TaxID=1883 RepID=UPI0031FCE3E4